MQAIELTVKNLDEAAQAAAEQLGVSPDQVKITVLEESKKLFGKVSYKVKAEVKSSGKAPKAAPAEAAPAPAAAAATPAASSAPAGEARKKLGSKKKEDAAEATAEPAEAAPAAAPKARPAKTTKAKATEKPAEPAVESAAAPADANGEDEGGPEVSATPEDAAQLGTILKTLAKKSGLDAEITVGELQGKYINLAIAGREAGFLVGKNGEVLNSLQYLINLVAKQQLANGVRVTLDGNDYRKKRAESLTNLAMKIADKVKERGEEAVLEALPAFERRVIHKALQEIEGVTTYSEGEEPDRRVVIAPID